MEQQRKYEQLRDDLRLSLQTQREMLDAATQANGDPKDDGTPARLMRLGVGNHVRCAVLKSRIELLVGLLHEPEDASSEIERLRAQVKALTEVAEAGMARQVKHAETVKRLTQERDAAQAQEN
jgi:hypothetical protein